jgi:hypothetical protein
MRGGRLMCKYMHIHVYIYIYVFVYLVGVQVYMSTVCSTFGYAHRRYYFWRSQNLASVVDSVSLTLTRLGNHVMHQSPNYASAANLDTQMSICMPHLSWVPDSESKLRVFHTFRWAVHRTHFYFSTFLI